MPSTGAGTVTVSNATAASVYSYMITLTGHATDAAAVGYLKLRGDDGNAGNFVYVGDAALTTTNYGDRLAASANMPPINMAQGTNNIDTRAIFVLASAGATKLNIFWEYA